MSVPPDRPTDDSKRPGHDPAADPGSGADDALDRTVAGGAAGDDKPAEDLDRTLAGPAGSADGSDEDGSEADRGADDGLDRTLAGPATGSGDDASDADRGADDGLDRTLAGPAKTDPPPSEPIDRTVAGNPPASPDPGGLDATLAGGAAARPRPPADGPDQTVSAPDQPAWRPPEDDSLEARRARAARAGDTVDAEPPRAPDGSRLSPAESALLGKRLGDCRIECLLGRGAMGAVFQATQLHLDRTVAVKTIRPDRMVDDALLQRFQREARALSRFTNPHVVQVYGAGEQDGVFYLVMQYVPGGTIGEYASGLPEKRVPERDAIRYLRECVLGLAEASELGILHRDIKPDNLLLDGQGRVMISDFGIAKVLDDSHQLTMSLDQVGTPLYMSPEQCNSTELDFRSDMWSLGATFFFLVTNMPPAKGTSILELIKTKSECAFLSPSKQLPDLGDDSPFSRIIERMTALDPDDRYSSWKELLKDLDHLVDAGLPTGSTELPSGTGHSVRPPDSTKDDDASSSDSALGAGRVFAALVIVAILGAGAWFGYQAWVESQANPIDDGPRVVDNGSGTQVPPNGGSDVDHPGGPVDDRPLDDGPIDYDPPADDSDPVVVVPPPILPHDPGSNGPGSNGSGDTQLVNSSNGTPPSDPQPDVSPADPDEDRSVLLSPDTSTLETARSALDDYQRRFDRTGPEPLLLDQISQFLANPIPAQLRSSDEMRTIREDMFALGRAATAAREAFQQLRGESALRSADLPFLALEQYVVDCRSAVDRLRNDDGAVPEWARETVASRLDEARLLGLAERSLELALRDLGDAVPSPDSSPPTDRARAAFEADATRIDEALHRLEALFPDWAESPTAGAMRQQLQEARSGLAMVDGIIPLRTRLDSLTAEVERARTLGEWRSLATGDQPIGTRIDSWDTDAEAWRTSNDRTEPPLSSERARLTEQVDLWKSWQSRLEATSTGLASGRSATAAAALLTAGAPADAKVPTDLTALAEALGAVAAVYDQLASDADLLAAGKNLRKALAAPAIQLLPAAGRSRLTRALDTVDALAARALDMVPVAGGSVTSDVFVSRASRESRRVEVTPFLISRFEVTRGEWIEFLDAIDLEQPEDPELWPDRSRRDARRLLPSLRRDEAAAERLGDAAAEEFARTAVDRVSWYAARAYARSRGAELPTHAQWWLAARGPSDAGNPPRFPWGDASVDKAPVHDDGPTPTRVDDGGQAARFGGTRSVHHLAGNVAEWLADEPSPRVYAVGGHHDLRASNRKEDHFSGERLIEETPTKAEDGIGLRLVLDPRAALVAEGVWLGASD